LTAGDPPPDRAALASFFVPFALAALCAGNGMGFYDSPELAAAGAGVGVTHPPGHPLWVAMSALFAMIPVGAIPLRIALGQALLLGILGRLAYAIARGLVERVSADSAPPWGVRALALAGALTATLGVGVFRQATRVEVYALAGVLAIAVVALAAREGDTLLAGMNDGDPGAELADKACVIRVPFVRHRYSSPYSHRVVR